MLRAWLVKAALFGILGACSCSDGTGSTGSADVCFHPAPTDSPFGCKPTYAQQVPALCAMETYEADTAKRAGTCESFQVTLLSTPNYLTWCFYGTEGALVGATRCSEGFECGASGCIDSDGPPNRNLPRCEPDGNACGVADAGT